jgi:hypothetical protein
MSQAMPNLGGVTTFPSYLTATWSVQQNDSLEFSNDMGVALCVQKPDILWIVPTYEHGSRNIFPMILQEFLRSFQIILDAILSDW